VVTAIGHEVDFTIADFVADLRAPTPSAAAEMVLAAKTEFSARIDHLQRRLGAGVHGQLQRRRVTLQVLERRRGFGTWPARLALRGRHVAELSHELRAAIGAILIGKERQHRAVRARLDAHDMRRRLVAIRGQLSTADGRLRAAAARRHERAQARVGTLAARIETLSPLAVLGRGYAVCWNVDRTAIVRRASAVQPGDHVRVTLHEGELYCEVRPEKPEK
jgi:exodeoxyribonuclease VII large subunit